MAIVGRSRELSLLHISSFRIVIAQTLVLGCSTVTRVSEEQEEQGRWLVGQRGAAGCAS